MRASLKEFLRDGRFGSIELGAGRAAIEQLLGLPEAWEAKAHNYQQANIWKFGDIEFYFQNDALWMIFMDDFKVPTGGNKIDLDAWAISAHLTCSQAEAHLSSAAIPYQKGNFPYTDNGVRLITGAGTLLAFSGENPAQPTLHAIQRRLEAP